MWCLEGEECAARKFKDRDESRWVLQKWEEEVEVGKILHSTQSHAETTPSSPCALPATLPHPDGNSSLPAIASPNASPANPPLPWRNSGAIEETGTIPESTLCCVAP